MSKYKSIAGLPEGKIQLSELTAEQTQIIKAAGAGTGMTLDAFVKALNKTRKTSGAGGVL